MSGKLLLAIDLVPDQALIEEYEDYHRRVWPEIKQSLRDCGIKSMGIYRLNTRLVMVLETTNDFTLERKAQMDAKNPKVQEWEALMEKYQQVIPGGKPGQRWQIMEQVFKL